MTTIILLSIIGAVVVAVVGTVWYSPVTPMGKIHMQYRSIAWQKFFSDILSNLVIVLLIALMASFFV